MMHVQQDSKARWCPRHFGLGLNGLMLHLLVVRPERETLGGVPEPGRARASHMLDEAIWESSTIM